MHVLLPGLLATLVWVPFVVALRHGRRLTAAGVVAAWSVALAAALPALERWSPGVCARSFVGAGEYAAQMAAWARTGVGCESDPTCFVPQHLLHAVAFAVGSVATAGLAGLAFAAVLFGWMGAYAAALAAASGSPVAAAALAWHPWAVVRVVAYLSLGVACAEPLARRGLPALSGRGRWIAFGVAGLVADIALKALFAPFWQRAVLSPLLGLD